MKKRLWNFWREAPTGASLFVMKAELVIAVRQTKKEHPMLNLKALIKKPN